MQESVIDSKGLHIYLWLEEGSRLRDSGCLQALYVWMCVYIYIYIYMYIIMYKQMCPKLVSKSKV